MEIMNNSKELEININYEETEETEMEINTTKDNNQQIWEYSRKV